MNSSLELVHMTSVSSRYSNKVQEGLFNQLVHKAIYVQGQKVIVGAAKDRRQQFVQPGSHKGLTTTMLR